VYAGLALPGWIVAARYEPPSPATESISEVTSKVTSNRLFEEYKVEAVVESEKIVTMSLPDGAALTLDLLQEVKAGEPVYRFSTSTRFAIECDVDSVEILPGEKGGNFLKCIHSLLQEKGYKIDDSDKSKSILGQSTKSALQQFFDKNDLKSPVTDPNFEQNIENAEYEYIEAKNTFKAIPTYTNDLSGRRSAIIAVERSEKALERLRENHGVYVKADNWISIAPGQKTVVSHILNEQGQITIQLDSGSKKVIAEMPASILESNTRKWLINDNSETVGKVKLGKVTANERTGIPEIRVEIELLSEDNIVNGGTASVIMIADDTNKKVLNVPGGALQGSTEKGEIIFLSDGIWQTLEVKNVSVTSGRLILPQDSPLKVGDEVKLA